MDQIKIKVDTVVLVGRAESAEKKITEVRNRFTQIENIVRNSENHWIGDAGDSHRNEYRIYKDVIETALVRFMENVTDLRRIASVYEKAQSEAMDMSRGLPSDVII